MVCRHEIGGQEVRLGRQQPDEVVDVLVLAGGRLAGVVEVSVVDDQPSLARRRDHVGWRQPFRMVLRNRTMGARLDAVLNLRNDKVDVRRCDHLGSAGERRRRPALNPLKLHAMPDPPENVLGRAEIAAPKRKGSAHS